MKPDCLINETWLYIELFFIDNYGSFIIRIRFSY